LYSKIETPEPSHSSAVRRDIFVETNTKIKQAPEERHHQYLAEYVAPLGLGIVHPAGYKDAAPTALRISTFINPIDQSFCPYRPVDPISLPNLCLLAAPK
jgi:hypothetical protein